jgi:hypothetical protein
MRRRRHAAFWVFIAALVVLFPPGAAILAVGYAGQWAWERWGPGR